jgi:hypothetical protein
MDRSQRVCSTDEWMLSTYCMNAQRYMTYQWTSDHTLMYFISDDRNDTVLCQFNVATGKRARYRTVSDMWDRDGTYAKEIVVSPDGNWILWWGDFADHQYNGCYGARRDGTGKFRFDEPYSRLIWLPDSKCFITDTSIRSVQPPVRIGLSPASLPRVEDFGEIQYVSDRYAVGVPNELANSNTYVVDRYDLSATAPRKTSWRIEWPHEEQCEELRVSPSGDRIAWICVRNPVHTDAEHVRHSARIVTTALNGTQMREVGTIETIDEADAEHPSQFFARPHELHWLPDGKHISFVLKNELYTAPTN